MDDIDKKLLNDYQRSFPICAEPYKVIAAQLGLEEEQVMARLQALKENGHISRIGAVIKPGTVGASMLAAVKAPLDRLEEVAEFISNMEQVNHNYKREHDYNIWFVLNTPGQAELDDAVRLIEDNTGLKVLALPMLKDFHLDLGFAIKWH